MIARGSMITLLLWTALAGVATGNPAAQPTPGYSAATFYNLGNADARAGRPGAAVLNYERARLLTPDDPDLIANLRLVREAAHVPLDPPHWFDRAAARLNPTLMAWVGVAGVLLLGLGLTGIGTAGARQVRWLRQVTVPLGALLLGATFVSARALWPLLQEAVVLTPATPVRVTPVPMGEPAFVLAEADTVTVSGQHDDFYLIRTRTGRSGWVARGNVARVVPR